MDTPHAIELLRVNLSAFGAAFYSTMPQFFFIKSHMRP